MIRVTNLTRHYGSFTALEDVSFDISPGTILGLLGRNGAGKSTTLKILAGLIPPSSGSVHVDGRDLVADPTSLRTEIGFLPESPPLYLEMTVEAFIRHMGQLRGVDASRLEERVRWAMEAAQLTDRAHQVIATLSHGFRKRVGIAQAIVHDPKLVILDEPISGLDPTQIADMRSVIKTLAQDRVVMVSSHILSEVEKTCDRIIVLEGGRLVADGTEEELLGTLRLRLTVRGSVDDLRSWLQSRDGIGDLQIAATADGFSIATFSMTNDLREDIAAEAIAKGLGLRGLVVEQGLEELFNRLTQDARMEKAS
ncbi:MAG: ABC transporter ATP-binding protein [Myxococcota bacterium]